MFNMWYGMCMLLLILSFNKRIYINTFNVCCYFTYWNISMCWYDVTLCFWWCFWNGIVIFNFYIRFWDVCLFLKSAYQVNATTCIENGLGVKCMVMTGSMAVYRLSLAMVLFFAIFMILTVGVKTSSNYRGYLHNGFWLFKFILFACLIVVSFKVPFHGLIKDCNYFNFSLLNSKLLKFLKFSMDVRRYDCLMYLYYNQYASSNWTCLRMDRKDDE